MKPIASSTRLRGGYYTPLPIAEFLVAWGLRKGTKTVLEPSCGDGNIVEQILSRAVQLGARPSVSCTEISQTEIAKAKVRARNLAFNGPRVQFRLGDFFQQAAEVLAADTKFDLVIGNPPFVRSQDFPEAQRAIAFDLMRAQGLRPSRLANCWLPFVAISSSLVSATGRLAMVVPAELFQVGYAAEFRQFLASYFPTIDIVAFDRLVFPDIQQEVVLLLADKRTNGARGIRVHEISTAADLCSLRLGPSNLAPVKPVDHASEKWTKYFLELDEIELLRELRNRPDIPTLNKYLDVDVGVVTGDNDFFLLDDKTAVDFRLDRHTVPIVGRSAAMPGTSFGPRDLTRWAKDGKPARLFTPVPPLGDGARRYIAQGAKRGVDQGYKCRIRKDWYVVPSVWKPDLFFLRQADQAPRLIANKTNATCTDTLHRCRLRDGLPSDQVAVAFVNSLTWASSEIAGRSYGGGVMTYEPSEVERLPLPVGGVADVDPAEVDRLLRSKKLDDALDLVDRTVLIQSHGLSKRDANRLRGIWVKLRDRRRGRKARA